MKRAIIIAALLAIATCGKDKPKNEPVGGAAPPVSGSAVAGGSAADAATDSAAAAAADVPTEMDFETQAKEKITEKNVEAQAKALEDDLGK